jgi:hypothetical protein
MGEACPKNIEERRRRPEFTPCYRIIQDHIETFIQARIGEGWPLPEYVLREFDAFLNFDYKSPRLRNTTVSTW